MKLYHDPSSRSVRPFIVLEELGIPYEVQPISLRQGEHRSPEHRRRHPLGQIPVLEDGDTVLFESVAICLYLSERYSSGALRPTDPAELGLYYQWCAFVPGSLELSLTGAYLERQGADPIPGTPRLEQVLDVLCGPLAHHEHLLRSGYSTADVLVGSTLLAIRRLGVELPDALETYADRLAARPALRRAVSAAAGA